MVVISTVYNAFSRVPVDSVVCLYMVFSNFIVEVTISRRSSVFSQSYVQVSAGLTDICGLAVAAFDLVCLSVRLCP